MSQKKKLRDIRDENVYSDYKKLVYDGLYPNVIQRKLSLKYYIAPETIARIFYEKRKKARAADEISLAAQNHLSPT